MAGVIGAVLFDLDGVLVTTDELHYRAWKEMADREGIPFDRGVNERLRGVSRMESLAIILERAPRAYGPDEREALAAAKNERYRGLLATLDAGAVLPGAIAVLDGLASAGVPIAVGSSSRNARAILGALGLAGRFAAVVDGTDIARSKPDPEVFVLASSRVGVPPARCLVVEDAVSGVLAGRAAGCVVLGVGDGAALGAAGAHRVVASLADVDAGFLLAMGGGPGRGD